MYVCMYVGKYMGPTQAMISDLIKIEMAYINTSHPEFVGGAKALTRLVEKMQAQSGKGSHVCMYVCMYVCMNGWIY